MNWVHDVVGSRWITMAFVSLEFAGILRDKYQALIDV